jgi:hypothetical protein
MHIVLGGVRSAVPRPYLSDSPLPDRCHLTGRVCGVGILTLYSVSGLHSVQCVRYCLDTVLGANTTPCHTARQQQL